MCNLDCLPPLPSSCFDSTPRLAAFRLFVRMEQLRMCAFMLSSAPLLFFLLVHFPGLKLVYVAKATRFNKVDNKAMAKTT